MLISKDSILNQLPKTKLDERERVYIESLVHLIRIIDTSYRRLHKLLFDDGDNLATELPMIEVWNIIDTSHRLRCVLDKTPGIKKSNLWYKLPLLKLRTVEEIRHLIQHFDQEINSLVKDVKPLLGHLSWVQIEDGKEFQIKLIVPGTLRKFKGLTMVNPAGKSIRNQIDLITFFIKDRSVNVSDIYYKLSELVSGLEEHVKSK